MKWHTCYEVMCTHEDAFRGEIRVVKTKKQEFKKVNKLTYIYNKLTQSQKKQKQL